MIVEVNDGDTTYSIAQANGADWKSAIVIRNGLASEGTPNIADVSVGDHVYLTDGLARIVSGPTDTLYSISVAHNVRWPDLIVLRPPASQIGSSNPYVIGGRVLDSAEINAGLQIGDRVFLPHVAGCQCGDEIPQGGATSQAEGDAEATGETTDVEATTQECDDDRTHFVLHSTAGVLTADQLRTQDRYRRQEVKRDEETGEAVLDDDGKPVMHWVSSRSKGHVYVFANGTVHYLWPFEEKNVWATKIEYGRHEKNPPGRGKMIHVEIVYASGGEPTEDQYQTVATLYVQANNMTCNDLVIVPHIEVDRGFPNGHQDPENFDYNHFYEILRQKGVNIDSIEKFDHDRYWGSPSYRIPWSDDTNRWPPALSGNPHR